VNGANRPTDPDAPRWGKIKTGRWEGSGVERGMGEGRGKSGEQCESARVQKGEDMRVGKGGGEKMGSDTWRPRRESGYYWGRHRVEGRGKRVDGEWEHKGGGRGRGVDLGGGAGERKRGG